MEEFKNNLFRPKTEMNGRKTSSQDLRLVGLNRTIKKKSWFHEFHFDKEKRAKLVDIVAAFGGTMGLLTGFSLISVFEVLYFIVKIVVDIDTRGNWIYSPSTELLKERVTVLAQGLI